MSIASEITRINGNIASAYTAVSGKGGTLPAARNSANLPAAIESIPSGGEPYDGTVEDYVPSETWILNKTPNFNPMGVGLSFYSNGVHYITFRIQGDVDEWEIQYKTSSLSGNMIYYNFGGKGVWVDPNGKAVSYEDCPYKTITLDEPATGNLLTWLQANAVKQ